MSDPPPQPLAPPTQPGAIVARPRPSNWPNVIGIIAIVLGAGGVLIGVWTGLAPLLMRWFQPLMLAGQAEAMDDWLDWTMATAVIAALMAVLLLVGGIQLVRRRPSAPSVLRVWAVMRMFGGLFATIVSAMAQQAQFQAIQSGSGAAAMPMGGAVLDVMLFLGIAVGLAQPSHVLSKLPEIG